MLNLTQHSPTLEQKIAGVVEPEKSVKAKVRELITFNELPSAEEIFKRAEKLAQLAKTIGAKKALIGGAPFFMSALEAALKKEGITPFYSFSTRVVEEHGPVKKSIFKHAGFIKVA